MYWTVEHRLQFAVFNLFKKSILIPLTWVGFLIFIYSAHVSNDNLENAVANRFLCGSVTVKLIYDQSFTRWSVSESTINQARGKVTI